MTVRAEITLKRSIAAPTLTVDDVHFGRSSLRTNCDGQRGKAKAFLMM